jgi:hypothetical protein
MAWAEDGFDPQGVCDIAGDLSGSAAEGDQGVMTGIESALGRDSTDGLGGVLHRDGDKSGCGCLRG